MKSLKIIQLTGASLLVITGIFFSPIKHLYAEDTNAILQKKIDDLSKKVEELESRLNNQAPSTPAQQGPSLFNRTTDPFAEMDRLHDEINKVFQRSFQQGGPFNSGVFNNTLSYNEKVNLQDNKDKYVLTFDLTGFDKDKVSVEIQNNTLTISAQNSQQNDKTGPQTQYHEKSFGSFTQTLSLPDDADVKKMETRKEGNILKIILPKKNV